MEDDNISYIHFDTEEQRLRFIIAQFKKYDARRKNYMAHLQSLNEKYCKRINELEKLTEHQHEEIDELIDAYTNAKPLILNPKQKAYIYELIKRSTENTRNKNRSTHLEKQVNMLLDKNRSLMERNESLASKVNALEDIIKRLHNGK